MPPEQGYRDRRLGGVLDKGSPHWDGWGSHLVVGKQISVSADGGRELDISRSPRAAWGRGAVQLVLLRFMVRRRCAPGWGPAALPAPLLPPRRPRHSAGPGREGYAVGGSKVGNNLAAQDHHLGYELTRGVGLVNEV